MKIMEQIEQEQRHAAESEFKQSLCQLEIILHDETVKEQTVSTIKSSNIINSKEINSKEINSKENLPDNLPIDLAAWEDAVADIEQYFQEKKGEC
jgi:hypothetical protein